MIAKSANFLVALSLAGGLVACSNMSEISATDAGGAPAVPTKSGPFESQPLRLLINGMTADQALGSETAMVTTLEAYGVPRPSGATLGEWIKAIQDDRSGHGPLINGGPGGVSPRSLLDSAQEALEGGRLAAPPVVDVRGQIEKECVLPDGTVYSGYHFDGISPHGSGHLCVTVFTTTQRGNSGRTKTIAERFLVIVEPHKNRTGGFMVEQKIDSQDPNYNPGNVFPAFASASGMAISESVAGGRGYKLWASGTSIRVAGIWVDKNYNASSPDFKWVFQKKAYLSLRIANPDSCIDMLFMASPPSPDLPPGMSPPQYCLGRCANPPIVNTK